VPDRSKDLLADLNPVQREAVLHEHGPLLVVAGAGSGKTKLLTHRIAYLIRERKVSPFAILAITFTNKAAGEMRDRVSGLVGERLGAAMWVTTFHSACVRLLRKESSRLGYASSFTIYDDADSERLINFCLRDLEIDSRRFTPRQVGHLIGRAKDDLLDEDMYASNASGWFDQTIAEVYRLYQTRLRQANAMDFDDLILNMVHLYRLYPDVLTAHQDRFRHVLVDEFQDTNAAQFELVKLLAGRDRNICVVGDADQSVYAFRGADFRNVLRFEEEFPDARVITLEQNYRSTQTILDAANAVIEHNVMRKPKSLWTEMAGGELVTRYHAENEHDEATFISSELERLRDEGETTYSDAAIFYRTNAQSRVVEEVFTRFGIPYRVIGSLKFYERREIKDALAYLRLAVNPADEVSFKRIVNVPKRGIGDQTVAQLQRFAQERSISLLEAADRVEETDLSSRARSAVGEFAAIMRALRDLVTSDGEPARVLEVMIERSGYIEFLEAEGTIEALGRVENLQELVGVAREYAQEAAEGGVRGFLEQISLVSEADEIKIEEGGPVTLMTLHNAKGLEFPVVFIAGLEEGVFPHIRSMTEPAQLEEERRLCYVGITRAKRRLYLTHAWSRSLWGGTNYNPVSRFVHEIPEGLVRPLEPSEEQRAPEPAVPHVGIGDEVFHDRFGRGVVVSIGGSGAGTEATVHFAEEGAKRLMLAYAPLRKV
jgi:ATP-dependent DNA helicase UvrD/PcrA